MGLWVHLKPLNDTQPGGGTQHPSGTDIYLLLGGQGAQIKVDCPSVGRHNYKPRFGGKGKME